MAITLFPDGRILHNGVEMASDKMHDQWVVESDGDSPNGLITNWTRSSLAYGAAYLTGMTHSSGIFTFPKTGIYRVDLKIGYYRSDHRRYIGGIMKLSTDSGSSYGDLTRSYTGLYDVSSSQSYGTTISQVHVDIQNASTHRIKFECVNDNTVTVYGANDDIRTMVMFERIAGT